MDKMDARERLIEIMKYQGLNAKQFSLELGVSAGTISNIMSGRNKPSLELLQNIAAHYPHIQSSWLFMGEGDMYQAGYEPIQSVEAPDLFSAMDTSTGAHARSVNDLTQTKTKKTLPEIPISQRTVQKILIFYTDGTFEER